MNRTEGQLKELAAWRQKKNLNGETTYAKRFAEPEDNEPKTFHFFNYNPDLGPTDLSSVSLKADTSKDPAVFSIPLSFTEKSRTIYKQHDNTEFGFDIRAYMCRNNVSKFPFKK